MSLIYCISAPPSIRAYYCLTTFSDISYLFLFHLCNFLAAFLFFLIFLAHEYEVAYRSLPLPSLT